MAENSSDCAGCPPVNKVNPINKSRMSTAKSASKGNLTGALSESLGLAIGPDVGSKVGARLGAMPIDSVQKIIDTPGSPTQKKKMTKAQKENHMLASVGSGDFSLNAQYEQALVGAVLSAKDESKNSLHNSKAGPALMAATSLGVGVPKADMLGIGAEDSTMFKMFKLAAFGLKALCATLRGLSGSGRPGSSSPGDYRSKTEELLGTLLSITLNIPLLAKLAAIFAVIRALKENFGSFKTDRSDRGSDAKLAGLLTVLCDWVEQMEFGSPLVDSFRNESNKNMTNKALTKQLGDRFIGAGTYDSYARNNLDFDGQYKTLVGDIDSAKCAGCKGTADIKLTQGDMDIATLEFDPLTGMMREQNPEVPQTLSEVPTNIANVTLTPGTQYESLEPSIQYITTPTGTPAEIQVADVLTQPVSAGDDTLYVKDNTQFPVGSWMVLGEQTDSAECVQCQAWGSIIAATPLVNDHPPGTTLSPPSTSEPMLCSRFSDTPTISTPTPDMAPIGGEYKQQSVGEYFGKSIPTEKEQPTLTELLQKLPSADTLLQDNNITTEQPYVPVGDFFSQPIQQTYSTEVTQGQIETAQLEAELKEQTVPRGIALETDTPQIKYTDTPNTPENVTSPPQIVELSDGTFTATEPYGGLPVAADADSVESFWNGDTITREELKGTVLEDADMNAVSLLAPEDLEQLKNNKEVAKALKDAEEAFDSKLASELDNIEKLVLKEHQSGIIFGLQLPKLEGNQIVMNSERILMSARTQEVGIFAKRKFFVTTDDEITMNCKSRFVIKTDLHASIESPTIHLGGYTTRCHPSLKGDCTTWWLRDLCDWLRRHTHNDPHIGTGTPAQQGSLAALRARLPTLLSERIFISG